MTVASTTNRVDYTGNGSVDTYSYTFRIFAETDLLVTVRDTDDLETTLTLSTHYTVTDVGSLSGGTIALVNGAFDWIDGSGDLETGYHLTIRRVRPITQTTDIRNQGDFYPEGHEDEFDRQVMIDQQQQDEIDRSVRLPESVSSAVFDPTLPSDLIAGKALIVNAAGTGLDLATVDAATLSPLTTKGDIATYSTVAARLPVGTNDQFLVSDSAEATGLKWKTTLPLANGGTNATTKAGAFDSLSPMTTAGDIIYGGASGTGTRLAIGTTAHVLTVTGGVPVWATPAVPRSYVRLSVTNGYGSTNTKIRRYTTADSNTGTAITYADSAANGASFTINEDGIYSMQVSDIFNSGSFTGFSRNSSQLTTDIQSITAADALIYAETLGADQVTIASWSGFLTAGDVIRVHTRGQADSANASRARFSIVQVSK